MLVLSESNFLHDLLTYGAGEIVCPFLFFSAKMEPKFHRNKSNT